MLIQSSLLKRAMKLLILSLFVFTANSFAPTNPHPFKRNIAIGETNTLEGREISNAFTPINNMLLVKKAEAVDQTDGGIFLTGKVCFIFVLSCENI